MKVGPGSGKWGAAGCDASTNCGSSAPKNKMTFGLASCVVRPNRNARRSRPGASNAYPVPRSSSARTPRYVRYAIPSHFTATNRGCDATRSAPNPAAAAATNAASPTSTPAFAASELRNPPRSALETTAITAGPGTSDTHNATTANVSHACALTAEALAACRKRRDEFAGDGAVPQTFRRLGALPDRNDAVDVHGDVAGIEQRGTAGEPRERGCEHSYAA